MAARIRYRKPPITQRIIGVYRPMTLEDFEAKLPGWIERIKDEFPHPESFAEWFIDITQKEGIPLLKDAQPKARIIRLFWKRHPKGLKVFGMRLRPDRLVFHLRRAEDEPHGFEELYALMEKWLDRWAEHFGFGEVAGTSVEYVNLLDERLTPQFVPAQGGLQVGNALNIFTRIPGRYQNIAQPYDCKLRLVVDEKMPCFFDVRVRAHDEGENPGVRVDFTVTTRAPGKAIELKTALREIAFGHEIMLEQFDCFFTDEAKLSFHPDGIPTQ